MHASKYIKKETRFGRYDHGTYNVHIILTALSVHHKTLNADDFLVPFHAIYRTFMFFYYNRPNAFPMRHTTRVLFVKFVPDGRSALSVLLQFHF